MLFGGELLALEPPLFVPDGTVRLVADVSGAVGAMELAVQPPLFVPDIAVRSVADVSRAVRSVADVSRAVGTVGLTMKPPVFAPDGAVRPVVDDGWSVRTVEFAVLVPIFAFDGTVRPVSSVGWAVGAVELAFLGRLGHWFSLLAGPLTRRASFLLYKLVQLLCSTTVCRVRAIVLGLMVRLEQKVRKLCIRLADLRPIRCRCHHHH